MIYINLNNIIYVYKYIIYNMTLSSEDAKIPQKWAVQITYRFRMWSDVRPSYDVFVLLRISEQ